MAALPSGGGGVVAGGFDLTNKQRKTKNICIPRTIAMTIAVAATASGFEIKLAGESASEPGALPGRTVLLTNPSAEPIKVDLAISVQRNPQNRDYISNGQSSDAAPPVVGEPVLARKAGIPVPVGETVEVALVNRPLTTGAYWVGVRASSGDVVRKVAA